jgi:hypothetical protein
VLLYSDEKGGGRGEGGDEDAEASETGYRGGGDWAQSISSSSLETCSSMLCRSPTDAGGPSLPSRLSDTVFADGSSAVRCCGLPLGSSGPLSIAAGVVYRIERF